MEGVLDAFPGPLRRAVAEYAPLDSLPVNRWYADRRQSLFRFLSLGARSAVLASQDGEAPPTRRVFPIETATLLELGPDRLPPVPIATPQAHAGEEGHVQQPQDAPGDWNEIFGQFPFQTQDLFLDVFPVSRRATRFVGACRAHDRSRERIWAFAGTKREVLLVFGERQVPVDPFSPEATGRRLRQASWSVFAWRARGTEPALVHSPA